MAFGRGNAVSIAFEGKDEVSPVVRGIKQSMAGFKKDAAQGFGLAAGFNVMSTAINLGVQAFGAVVGAAGDAQRAYSDLNEATTKNTEVFKGSADSVEAWAKTAAESFGLSERAAIDASASIGNFMQSLGVGQIDAANMSTSITGLAGDLASFNNVAGGAEEVLVALRSGLAGEAEPMRRLGVDISAAAVEAKALSMGLAATKSELTQAMKVQARYAIIMEQTATAQGDFARTADGSANQSRLLDAKVENLNARMGGFIDTVVRAGQEVTIFAVDILGGLLTAIDNIDGSVDRATRDNAILAAGWDLLAESVKQGSLSIDQANTAYSDLEAQVTSNRLRDGLRDTFSDNPAMQGLDPDAIDSLLNFTDEEIEEIWGLPLEDIARILQENQADLAYILQNSTLPEGGSISALQRWIMETLDPHRVEAAVAEAADASAGEMAEAMLGPIIDGVLDAPLPEHLKQAVTVGLGHGMSTILISGAQDINTKTIGAEVGATFNEVLGGIMENASAGMDGLFGGFGGRISGGKQGGGKRGKGSLYRHIKAQIRLEKNNVRDLIRDPELLADIQAMYDEHATWLEGKMQVLGEAGNALGLAFASPLQITATEAAANLGDIGTASAIAFADKWGPAWNENVDPMIAELFAGTLVVEQGVHATVTYTNESLLQRMLEDDELRVTVQGVVEGKRAMGGDVAAGKSYLVGERGPEVVTLGGRGGRVTPNHAIGGGGAGNVYLDGQLVGRVVDERLGQMLHGSRVGSYYRGNEG